MNERNPTDRYQSLHRVCYLLPLVVALGVHGAIFLTPHLVDSRTRIHVELGETILQLGELPVSTQIADGYCWMNDSYLSQMVMAILARVGGMPSLAVACCWVALAMIASMLFYNRRDQVRWPAAVTAMILTSLVWVQLWRAGPQIASLVCFAALVVLLQHAFDGWRGKWHWTSLKRLTRSNWVVGDDELRYDSRRLRLLWLAAPLFCVWSNLHGGFQIGLVLYWSYLAMRALEAMSQRGQAGWGLTRRMVLMGVVAGLATFINPYGPWLLGWLNNANTLAQREALYGSTVAIFEIDLLWYASLLLGAMVVASHALAGRRNDLTQISVLVAAAALSLGNASNAPFFAIAAGFWMGIPLQELWIRIHSALPSHGRQALANTSLPNQKPYLFHKNYFSELSRVFAVLSENGNESQTTPVDKSFVGEYSRPSQPQHE